MKTSRGAAASKTEAIYFLPPRQACAAAGTSRYLVDGTGFVEFSESFKYLGSIIHCSLTSDADVYKRVKSATAAFGAMKSLFGDKYLSENKCARPWSCPLCFMAAKYGPFQKICSENSELPQPLCPKHVSHRHRPHYPPKHHLRKLLSPFEYLWISVATTTAESSVGLGSSHASR
jgi:hypothetical protein